MIFNIIKEFKSKIVSPFHFKMIKGETINILKIYDPINEEFVQISGEGVIEEEITIKPTEQIETDLSKPIKVKVKRLSGSVAPKKNRSGGYDLLSPINGELNPLEVTPIDLKLMFEIPDGFEGVITSSSDIADKFGVIIADTEKIINPSDNSSVKVSLNNLSNDPYKIKKNRKIAEFKIRDKKEIN